MARISLTKLDKKLRNLFFLAICPTAFSFSGLTVSLMLASLFHKVEDILFQGPEHQTLTVISASLIGLHALEYYTTRICARTLLLRGNFGTVLYTLYSQDTII